MPKHDVVRRAPSGDLVTTEWTGAPVVSHVSGARFAGGSYGRGFQIHPLGGHEALTERFLDARLARRFTVGRHEVRVSTAKDDAQTVATLIGPHHELMTIFSGPAPAARMISELFGVLDIDDAAEGMQVLPASATGLSMVNEHVMLVAGDTTSVDLPGPRHAQTIVPRHRGRKTAHGEVWRALLPGRDGSRATDYGYVVGTPHGAAEVEVAERTAVTDARLLAMLDSLDVRWSAGDARGKGRKR